MDFCGLFNRPRVTVTFDPQNWSFYALENILFTSLLTDERGGLQKTLCIQPV